MAELKRAGLVVLVALFAAIPPQIGEAQPAQPTTPCLGVLVPLSGKHARLGQSVLDAVNLAHSEHPEVELRVGDTKGDAAVAAAEVDRLAALPCVTAVLGPIGWRESRQAAARAQQHGLPILALSSEQGLEQAGPFVFRQRPSAEEQSEAMAQLAVSELMVERFAILYPDDTLGRTSARRFFEVVRRAGGRVTAMASYPAGETNLTAAVEELVGKRLPRLKKRVLTRPPTTWRRLVPGEAHVNFDAVFVPDYDSGVVLATKFLAFHDVPLAAVGSGASIQLLGTTLMRGPHHLDGGGLTTGALFPELFGPTSDHPGVSEFVTAFKEGLHREPSELEAHATDALSSLTLAVAKVPRELADPGTRRRRMLNALLTLEPQDGLTGLRWFNDTGEPGFQFQLWVVEPSGEVSPTTP